MSNQFIASQIIRLGFAKLGLQPAYDSHNALGYVLAYESGIELNMMVVISCRRKWFLKTTCFELVIIQPSVRMNIPDAILMTHRVFLPVFGDGLKTGLKIVSRLNVMARICADSQAAGDCLSFHPT